MSRHLADRIERTGAIEVLTRTEVTDLDGDESLAEVGLRQSGRVSRMKAGGLFVLLGAQPNTQWLGDSLALDQDGFIRTGPDLGQPPAGLDEPGRPFLLESSLPGVFAAGDVRSGSVKRVAAAVGEGATAVRFVHQLRAW